MASNNLVDNEAEDFKNGEKKCILCITLHMRFIEVCVFLSSRLLTKLLYVFNRQCPNDFKKCQTLLLLRYIIGRCGMITKVITIH